MAKRKSQNVRLAFAKAAESLWSAGKTINSYSLAKAIHADHASAFEADLRELAEIGLTVLAGRVSTANAEPTGMNDLFEAGHFPGLYRLRYEDNGRIRTRLVPLRFVTARMVRDQPSPRGRGKSKTSKTNVIFMEMIDKGDLDTNFRDYINNGV